MLVALGEIFSILLSNGSYLKVFVDGSRPRYTLNADLKCREISSRASAR